MSSQLKGLIIRHAHPERCVIGHPFNPPHVVPLVEIVGGAKTSQDAKLAAAHPGFTIQYRFTYGVPVVRDLAVYKHRYN